MNELLNNHPKTAALVRAYFMELFLESSKGLPEDFKEFARKAGMKDDNIIISMERSPSTMFRIFDTKDVFVSIVAKESCYVYRISNGSYDTTSECYGTRLEAEQQAVFKAFELLEELLPDAEPNEVG